MNDTSSRQLETRRYRNQMSKNGAGYGRMLIIYWWETDERIFSHKQLFLHTFLYFSAQEVGLKSQGSAAESFYRYPGRRGESHCRFPTSMEF